MIRPIVAVLISFATTVGHL